MKKVVFLHLDWGIGGAEQLMLQLAMASQEYTNNNNNNNIKKTDSSDPAAAAAVQTTTTSRTEIQLLTTRCDPHHCFAILQDRPPFLHIVGSWIPSHLYGRGQAFFSTVRLLYLACHIITHSSTFANADLIVTDVLPTPMILLRYCTNSALLFYCHFPDRLLIRSKPNNLWLLFFQPYRWLMNWIESVSMDLADTIVVNSNFTREIVLETFPQLTYRSLPVLYPALLLLDEVTTATSCGISSTTTATSSSSSRIQRERLLVSLNRFERKKNLELLIHTMVYLRQTYPNLSLPRVIIAGGYDLKNKENVEYRDELGRLVQEHHLETLISFEHSITDLRRIELFKTAMAVVYTPDREHFGIVPVEAMAVGTPVVCCKSGGPQETVLHGVTGYLCHPPTTSEFGKALQKLLDDPRLVEQMGKAARQHALSTFGMDRFQSQWHDLVTTTMDIGKKRVSSQPAWYRRLIIIKILSFLYVPLLLCWILFGLRMLWRNLQHETIPRQFTGFGKEEF